MAESVSARFREHLRTSDYSVSYHSGPRFERVKRRGRKAKWLMDGVPVPEGFAVKQMRDLDAARRH